MVEIYTEYLFFIVWPLFNQVGPNEIKDVLYKGDLGFHIQYTTFGLAHTSLQVNLFIFME